MATVIKLMMTFFFASLVLTEVSGQPQLPGPPPIVIRQLRPMPIAAGPQVRVNAVGMGFLFSSCPPYPEDWRGGSLGYEYGPLTIMLACLLGGILPSAVALHGNNGRRLPHGGRLYEWTVSQCDICALMNGVSVRLYGNLLAVLSNYCSWNGFQLRFENAVINADGFWDSRLSVRCGADFLATPFAEWTGLTGTPGSLAAMRQRFFRLFGYGAANGVAGQDQLQQHVQQQLATGQLVVVAATVSPIHSEHIALHAEDEWRQRNADADDDDED